MDARENALRIIRFDHPDRVMVAPPVYEIRYQGANHEGFEGDLGDDHPVGTRWVDVWQTGWHKIQDGVMGLPEVNPLAEIGNLERYRWPGPDDERICTQIYRMAEAFPGGDLLLAGSHRDTLWEKAYMLVGMEDLMVYFLSEPDFVREVLHRIMDFQLGIARHYIALGVEFARLGDDLGTQMGPLLGPRIVGEFLVPEYERLFRLYRERNVLIGFHSCGNVASVLESLMQLGVDVLNPVQATANDLAQVRAVTQGRMALQGGVSSATIMEGPIDRIVDETRERMWQLGREGGYFCGPDQGMPYPRPHIDALYQAVEQYGRYPLQPPQAEAGPAGQGAGT
jgi:uroporphyrinogen decarboxylase